MKRCFVLIFPVLLLMSPGPAAAASSYDSCSGTISSLPAVISGQGTWCMKADLAATISSGSAISVTANNVTIDCNGFKLSGLGVGAATATVGVLATDRVNVVVRDCHIRGFRNGLEGSGSAFQVSGNRFEGNTQRGLLLTGDHHVVRSNLITDTGGSTIGTGAAYGVLLYGSSEVLDNTIGSVYARAGSAKNAWGIFLGDAGSPASPMVVGNRIRQVVSDTGISDVAIRTAVTGRPTIADNALFGNQSGIAIHCSPAASGAVRGNSMLGFTTGLSGCSNDGGNIFKSQ